MAGVDLRKPSRGLRAGGDERLGRATLVIAHRLATIAKADRVFTVKGGTVWQASALYFAPPRTPTVTAPDEARIAPGGWPVMRLKARLKAACEA